MVFKSKSGSGTVEFALDNPGAVLHSQGVAVEDIEQLSFFLRDNQDIIKAELKGQWVEVPEDIDQLFNTPPLNGSPYPGSTSARYV